MKWLHRILKGLSFSTALFVFQSCYGTPMMYTELEFHVVSAEDGAPVPGAKVQMRLGYGSGKWHRMNDTDEYGNAHVYINSKDYFPECAEFLFDASDRNLAVKDTLLTDLSMRSIDIQLKKAE